MTMISQQPLRRMTRRNAPAGQSAGPAITPAEAARLGGRAGRGVPLLAVGGALTMPPRARRDDPLARYRGSEGANAALLIAIVLGALAIAKLATHILLNMTVLAWLGIA